MNRTDVKERFATGTVSRKGQISKISIGLASPNAILEKSYGEVTKPETINYRSFKPEKDGLFCEKIFGPVKDWECHCGKYKRIRYKGIICDRCGVEVTTKAVRRERMGHISLAVPIVHIWYFRSTPTKIGYMLNISPKYLEKIIYYEAYVVIQPGKTSYKTSDVLTEEEYMNVLEGLSPDERNLSDDNPDKFVAGMGGEAIREMLSRLEIEELSEELRNVLKTEKSKQKKYEALKRLKVVEAFRTRENGELKNKPEWMVMDVIPVIPPELRPLVPLEGGRFATSDLNDLYRRVIIRNNRLKKLIDIKAPEVILRNEKRMLQESVDALFDNTKRTTAVRSDGNRPLKSLSDMLRGKQGRFRLNLLGKRVDYSGRSVIVVGPKLKLYECGLPKEMAVELFKPFIIRKLQERKVVKTVKSAKRIVDKRDAIVFEVLEEIVGEHPVLLNRAPTLHRLGIQAFQPVLIEGKAIEIHPLVCAAFNADFDGDQMAVHVPLSYEAQMEARMLMLSSHNILSPANGRPLAVPSQDMVLGCYYVTKEKKGVQGEGKIFSSIQEVIIALNDKKVNLHAIIKVRVNGELIETTVGRVLFNKILPPSVGFVNLTMTKKVLEGLISRVLKETGNLQTVRFLDNLKELGFRYSTLAGSSIGLDDIVIPEDKEKIIDQAYNEVRQLENQYQMGIITDGERYNKVIDIWTRVTEQVSSELFKILKDHKNGFNSLYMMSDSGARGSKEQIRQLAGMRGLMAKPQKTLTGQTGEIIENPITANFFEGLTVQEYFISTHGARKGLADTALKTADAGYLTRRLVDVAQDVMITQYDCGTILGIETYPIKEGERVIESLADRVLGRVAVEDVYEPLTGDLIINGGSLIDEEKANLIEESAIESIKIRSVLTCEAERGVCSLCYGRNLAAGRMVSIGEAVGIMAAQSIGEPGTQLTLRTFHIGGIAGRIAAQSQVMARFDGKVKTENLRLLEGEEQDEEGNIVPRTVAIGQYGKIHILDNQERSLVKYTVPTGANVQVEDGQMVKRAQVLFEWDPYSTVILAEKPGIIKFVDIVENVTAREELDEHTLQKQRVVIESRNKNLSPHIKIVDEDGNEISTHILPVKAQIRVTNGQKIKAGAVIARIPREIGKTRDITGGLPRVAELFEARKPKEQAIVSEIDGMVRFGTIKRGIREIIVEGTLEKKKYLVPYSMHVLVHNGDYVKAGEMLTEGSIAPQDILQILGPNKVQEYLVNEIQEVYRLQGVSIDDKHIEVIARQMMQRVRVLDPGDTRFLEGDTVNKVIFKEENEKIRNKVVITEAGDSRFRKRQLVDKLKFEYTNRQLQKAEKTLAEARDAEPATSEPILLGITQAALTTDSFISAASFQETTRVLTEAAVAGKVDYLFGLKENVIVGNLIPVGTGMKKFEQLHIDVKTEAGKETEVPEPVPAK
ncbi:MAG: DNA-directed RNA polymerase subunit beta' [Calditrichaeota bacterium]|nr:DNA-directed RNA polymerase subunit beta' [Calditrichota bacterium]RQW06250.1 MAG: DNA-directed RNA polymerase subunit beta' [Calditrichota bacterium]